jgi:hypothetical protein
MLLNSALGQRSPRHARWTFILIVAVLLGVSPQVALAQLSDVKGSKDHPMVSRYAGSVIIGYDFRKFDEFVIPLGALRRTGGRPAAGGGKDRRRWKRLRHRGRGSHRGRRKCSTAERRVRRGRHGSRETPGIGGPGLSWRRL